MSAVYKAIHGVLTDLSKIGIGKDKKNQQQGFQYRGVDDVMNVVSSLLAKHGLLILPRVTKRECIERQSAKGNALFYTILEVEYDFVAAVDGTKHVVGPFVGEAMDSGDKSSNKAMSIAYKYACFEAFCIPVEAENDPDATVHDVKPKVWDGIQQVGHPKQSKTMASSRWCDVPEDFLTWCNNSDVKLPDEMKKAAVQERTRRQQQAAEFDRGMPDNFYGDGARQ